ncbi:hypothetical protein MUG91_G3n107 [Manis pentadactyla]|nr:hypothetical protein MUG91_G3n107 [Manis pentadactyla]
MIRYKVHENFNRQTEQQIPVSQLTFVLGQKHIERMKVNCQCKASTGILRATGLCPLAANRILLSWTCSTNGTIQYKNYPVKGDYFYEA